MSGDFVVEESPGRGGEVVRRLVFLSAPHLVQTEVRVLSGGWSLAGMETDVCVFNSVFCRYSINYKYFSTQSIIYIFQPNRLYIFGMQFFVGLTDMFVCVCSSACPFVVRHLSLNEEITSCIAPS